MMRPQHIAVKKQQKNLLMSNSNSKQKISLSTNLALDHRKTINNNLYYRPTKNYANIIRRQKIQSRSIEVLPNKKIYQNTETLVRASDVTYQQGLFAESYRKIGSIRKVFGANQTIQKQLGEILELIKQEKSKIYETMKNLQIASTYYKSIADARNLCREDAAVNTDYQPHKVQQNQYGAQTQIQSSNTEPITQKSSISSSPSSSQSRKLEQLKMKQSLTKEQQAIRQQQTYQKLAELLSEMKIDYRTILPDNIDVKVEAIQGKQLTEKETIKIQKYLIKKLAQKTVL